jgi:hypothetical protein
MYHAVTVLSAWQKLSVAPESLQGVSVILRLRGKWEDGDHLLCEQTLVFCTRMPTVGQDLSETMVSSGDVDVGGGLE